MNEDRLNPWKSIWFQPRATIRQQADRAPEAYVFMLVILSSMGGYLVEEFKAGDNMDSWRLMIFMCILLVPLIGLLGLYVGAGVLHFTGRWLGGRGRTVHLRTALAWSYYPLLIGSVIVAPMLIYSYVFSSDSEQGNPSWLSAAFFLVFDYGLMLWSLVISLIGISEIQRFSIWKALLNSMLAFFVIFIPFAVIFGVFFFAVLAR